MNNFSVEPPYHRPELVRYVVTSTDEKRTESGAYKAFETVRFELFLPRSMAPSDAAMFVWLESGGEAHKYEMNRVRLERGMDVFEATISMKEMTASFGREVGLFYFGFDFLSNGEKMRVIQSLTDGLPEICRDDRGDGAFALTVYDRKYPAPMDWYGGIIYHIFVDRFAKSGKCQPKSYAVMNDDWYGGEPQYPEYPGAYVANDMFFGGDLWGVKEKLDYLESLGVTVIYLSPIFEARSNHKYDTGDFEKVDSMFGGKRALTSLLNAAKKRGISVILDGVFNHTGSDSKYFNKYGTYKNLGAYQSEKSKYHKWFSFGESRDEYTSWWGIDILPRVNSYDSDYINYINGENGIIDRYTELGVSGWRLDVVDELPDNFVDSLAARVHKSFKDEGHTPIVIGEVWEDASCKISYGQRRRYFQGEQLDSVMNYPVRSALIEYMKSGDAELMTLALHTIWEHYPAEVVHSLMNLLGTHDTARIITCLAGDPADEYSNAELLKKRMTPEQYAMGERLVKLSYLINATIPGIPSIYYGDEVGMEGYGDPFNRMPFPWGRENKSLLEHYRAVGQIRRENPVYRDGELVLCRFKIDGFLMYGRKKDGQIWYTAVNRGGDDVVITVTSAELVFFVGDVTDSSDTIKLGKDSGVIIKANSDADVYADSCAEEADETDKANKIAETEI